MSTPSSAGDAPASSEPAEATPRASTAAGPRRPRRVFLLAGVALAVVLGIGLFATAGSKPGPGRPQAGAPVPDFSLPKLGGSGKVGVPADGGGQGRPAVLLFFASWCGPCRGEVPALAATYRREHADGSRLARVAMIGIDGSDPTSSALSFVRSSGVTFPVGADRAYTVTQGLFAFTGLPEAVFVEANGTIAGIHYGALSTSQFVSWQRELLAHA